MNGEWSFGEACIPRYDPADKQTNIANMNRKDLARFCEIFSINGLPDYIEEDQLKYLLLTRGYAVAKNINGKLYIVEGSLGGKLNELYFPTLATIANPYLNFSDNCNIGEDCEVVRCDSSYQGILPILNKYNRLIAENEITMWMVCTNMRAQRFLAASDNKSIESAQEVIDKLVEGDFGVIADPKFLTEQERVQSLDWGSGQVSNSLIAAIEHEQYLKGAKDMELGLRSPYNMKREALGDSEVSAADMSLLPYIDNVINCLQKDFEKVNKMFGTSITIEKTSAWDMEEEEMENKIEEEEEDDSKQKEQKDDFKSNDDNRGSAEED